MNLTPEEKDIGKENFENAVGGPHEFSRRDFLKGTVAAGAVSGVGLGAMYFNYTKQTGNPVRVAWIGTGDEGSVLLGAHTPDYLNVVAICDIRPYNVWRAFHGDHSSETANKARPGLIAKYKDWKTEDVARKNVIVYTDYKDVLKDKNVEAVVIALPLHLHARVAIEAMRNGKHVLTEKLMGQTVARCKEMGRVSKETGKLLATGHQRHYSILYDNAMFTVRQGIIGDIHHIRAQWHRGNSPGKDSWQPPVPGVDKQLVDQLKRKKDDLATSTGADATKLAIEIEQLEHQLLDANVNAAAYGYMNMSLPDGKTRTALEELIRWRLWNRTGGGLMAELGSHQLDASSLFVSAEHAKGKDGPMKKIHPLTVTAVGGRSLFPADRECEDHVYCMYEFPAPGYEKDPNKKIVVTYSSINGNGFGDYGEVVMGTQGTIVLEREQEVMLYPSAGKSTKVGVKKDNKGKAVLDTTASGGGGPAKAAINDGPPSRGYTEELEHWAWCIRHPDPQNIPRCHPTVALGDAVIALTTNEALRNPGKKTQITFDEKWFDIDKDDTPDNNPPDLSQYKA